MTDNLTEVRAELRRLLCEAGHEHLDNKRGRTLHSMAVERCRRAAYRALPSLLDTIDALEQAQRWNPVPGPEMPAVGVVVELALHCHEDEVEEGPDYDSRIVVAGYLSDVGWHHHCGLCSDVDITSDVYGWRPLPDPPEVTP